jgi:hypothetical protein
MQLTKQCADEIDYVNYNFPSITRKVNVMYSEKVPARGSVRFANRMYYDADAIIELSKSVPKTSISFKVKKIICSLFYK